MFFVNLCELHGVLLGIVYQMSRHVLCGQCRFWKGVWGVLRHQSYHLCAGWILWCDGHQHGHANLQVAHTACTWLWPV